MAATFYKKQKRQENNRKQKRLLEGFNEMETINESGCLPGSLTEVGRWNHHEEIKHIDIVRAYTFGSHYFVEVDIILPEDMLLNQAHNIGEMLQEKLEQLPQVEQSFVHIDLSSLIDLNTKPRFSC